MGKKLVDLARAVPEEKYGWRPGRGVRSVSEAYMHVASATFFLPTFAGVTMPEGVEPDMEKETDKAKVLAALARSFAYARNVVQDTPDDQLDRKAKWFSGEKTVRGVLLALGNHAHEHLASRSRTRA